VRAFPASSGQGGKWQGDSFVNDKPRVWLDKLGGTQWDLAPDGKRALVLPVAAPEAPKQEHTVVFLENFPDAATGADAKIASHRTQFNFR